MKEINPRLLEMAKRSGNPELAERDRLEREARLGQLEAQIERGYRRAIETSHSYLGLIYYENDIYNLKIVNEIKPLSYKE